MRILLFLLIITSLECFSQDKNFFDDFQGIKNGETVFYENHGISISTETYSYRFNEKGLKRVFRKYKLNFKKAVKLIDSELGVENYFVKKTEKIIGDYKLYSTVYFIKNNEFITVMTFNGLKNIQPSFEKTFIKNFFQNKIPKTIYVAPKIDTIQFVKRPIRLVSSCQWMGVRNVQCPFNGQMDWTMHETIEDAREFNKIREALTTKKKKIKLISRKSIDVIFEGKKTKAIKIVYDIRGIQSLLVNLSSGAKNLIVYYIAETIRGKNVSCILSHWDNDHLQANGLPALLGEVMQLPLK